MEFEIIKNDEAKVFVNKTSSEDIDYYAINVEYVEPTVPKNLKIVFRTPLKDTVHSWTPMTEKADIYPVWSPLRCFSTLAKSMPLIGLLSEDCQNRGLVALSDVKNQITLTVGMIEETCEAIWTVCLFENAVLKIKDYRLVLRMDNRDVKFTDCVKAVALWWETLGCTPAVSPSAAFETTYSTWYNFHQNITPTSILEELQTAKDLGFKTVIVDDGWQCSDNSRGYAYTGDWKPVKEKIGNVKDFCAACHTLGFKVMLWFSVPFVGPYSKNYNDFSREYLYEQEGGWRVLDPRYKRVRDFLINLYKNALINYDLDGLKLDFIDCFYLREDSPAVNIDMDIPVLEDAVYRLMSDVYNTLKCVKKDVLIEFRQSYVGPMIRSFGNMLRVGDCPYSAETNIRAIAELRLTSGKTAVHSDMLTWHKDTPCHDVARQLVAVLFSVPQISVLVNKMPQNHLSIIKEFIKYRTENLDILMHGEFDCAFPCKCDYMSVYKDGKQIAALYRGNLFTLTNKVTDVFFATKEGERVLDLTKFNQKFSVTVKDCFYKVVKVETLSGLCKVFVPSSGLVEIRPL